MEIWDLYTAEGQKTGRTILRGEKLPAGLYHMVCEVLVRHKDGSYLLMRLAPEKKIYPNCWEATAGGSALAGEAPLEAARRENAARPAPVETRPSLAVEELEAYRRAERIEREARERAELVYFQANGVLTEASAKVDGISAEITDMADQVMLQLTQLQIAVSSSKQALQDASSIMGTIRPNK
jgi:isopentenyldiphosphate isomerase